MLFGCRSIAWQRHTVCIADDETQRPTVSVEKYFAPCKMMVSTKQRAQSIQIASTSANEESNTSSPEIDESALKQDALELQPAEADKQKEHSKNADFSVVYDYWKNFDIKKLQ
ncbi:hypothetical protein BpHYR1_015025, partial [Brachionus plicatilis]